jgi:hypothetical protein
MIGMDGTTVGSWRKMVYLMSRMTGVRPFSVCLLNSWCTLNSAVGSKYMHFERYVARGILKHHIYMHVFRALRQLAGEPSSPANTRHHSAAHCSHVAHDAPHGHESLLDRTAKSFIM